MNSYSFFVRVLSSQSGCNVTGLFLIASFFLKKKYFSFVAADNDRTYMNVALLTPFPPTIAFCFVNGVQIYHPFFNSTRSFLKLFFAFFAPHPQQPPVNSIFAERYFPETGKQFKTFFPTQNNGTLKMPRKRR